MTCLITYWGSLPEITVDNVCIASLRWLDEVSEMSLGHALLEMLTRNLTFHRRIGTGGGGVGTMAPYFSTKIPIQNLHFFSEHKNKKRQSIRRVERS